MSEIEEGDLLERFKGAFNSIATDTVKIEQIEELDELDDVAIEYFERIQETAMNEYEKIVNLQEDKNE